MDRCGHRSSQRRGSSAPSRSIRAAYGGKARSCPDQLANCLFVRGGSCLIVGFAFKRPKKRLLKADQARKSFVEEYAALGRRLNGQARIFFADEAHFRADAELPGCRHEHSTSPRYQLLLGGVPGDGEVEWSGWTGGQQQLRDLGGLLGPVEEGARWTALGQRRSRPALRLMNCTGLQGCRGGRERRPLLGDQAEGRQPRTALTPAGRSWGAALLIPVGAG